MMHLFSIAALEFFISLILNVYEVSLNSEKVILESD
jgi:hypothetical protein